MIPTSRFRLAVAAALVALALTGCAAPAPAPSVRDDLQQVFARAGVTGTFVLREPDGALTLVDAARAAAQTIPSSTFKLPHTVIALETGAVTGVDEVLPYGGQDQPFDAWERDMSLREALPASNIAIYQEVARRVGAERESEWLARLGYGNQQVGDVLERFWLDGPLMISPIEQAAWVARLAARELPASRAAQDATAELARLESTPAGTLYGKTGWRFDASPGTGWWVGWVERPDGRITTFALFMDTNNSAEAAKRVPIGRELLAELDVLPAD
ncbi:penicillin-binding transpeptidase domain-containing protein [Pseudonocardia sp. TRM90224]|uniref:penicillin-binding transpeptidase domain-containing protein n=1 Tax=Pseudonocardia sp. TRM90224 TaxID=2812678 RepID=UPI001E5139A7|nr:penicillin-binding transpeptidase domain-containing protein [Pseudonocardia sp. TRM90224]